MDYNVQAIPLSGKLIRRDIIKQNTTDEIWNYMVDDYHVDGDGFIVEC